MKFYGLAFLLLVLVGCAKQYPNPKFYPEDSTFKGIRPSAEEEVSLVLIHGMCNHGCSWSEDMAKTFAKPLGLKFDKTNRIFGNGISEVSAYKNYLTGPEYNINFYSILYSPVTKIVKQQNLCSDVDIDTVVCPFGGNGYPYKRARLNGQIKSVLLNDCLADAVIYLGETGKVIREGVRGALVAIHNDRASVGLVGTSPLTLISQSLGSKVLRDSIVCSSDNRVASSILPTLADLEQVFLISNQIPLLKLGVTLDECGPDKGRGFSDLLRAVRKEQKNRELDKQSIKVISFTDPNDLLSYAVDPDDYNRDLSEIGGDDDFKVTNVIISNEKTFFGYLENPYQAHTGYLKNKKILNLITDGNE